MNKLIITFLILLTSINANANLFSSIGKFVTRKISTETAELSVKELSQKVIREMSEEEADTFYIVASTFFVKNHVLTIQEVSNRCGLSLFSIRMFAMRNDKLFKVQKQFGKEHISLTTVGMRSYRDIEKTLSDDVMLFLEEMQNAGAKHNEWIKLSTLYNDSDAYRKELESFIKYHNDLVETKLNEEGDTLVKLID